MIEQFNSPIDVSLTSTGQSEPGNNGNGAPGMEPHYYMQFTLIPLRRSVVSLFNNSRRLGGRFFEIPSL